MEAYLLASLLVAAGLALIPASIAKNKGYSFGLWWFYGWMLFILAIIHVSLIPDKKAQQTPINPSSQNPSNNGGSVADELKKFKELMDQGVITEKEFQAKKEELLKPTVVKKTVIAGGDSNIDSILKRAFMFLEDKEWGSADGYCEKVLDINPECAEAYLGKLMVSLKVSSRQELKNCSTVFDNEIYFQKAMRYADDNLKKELQGYIDFIVNRNITDAYNEAIKTMEGANSEEEYKNAAAKFQRLNDFKDSVELAKECLEKAEESKLTALYDEAISTMNSAKTEQQYRLAADKFSVIKTFKDAEEKRIEAERLAEEKRIEAERLAEEMKIASAKAAKKRNKIIAIVSPIVCVCIVLVILLNTVIIPNNKYNDAIALMNNEKYEDAIKTFEQIKDYKDSEKQISTCISAAVNNYLSKKDTDGAIKWCEKIGDSEYANKIRYDYVLANKNKTDKTTYEYLKILSHIDYKDSNSIYKELYSWDFEVFINSNITDYSTKLSKAKYSKGDLYLHYRFTGGYPGMQLKLKFVHERNRKRIYSDDDDWNINREFIRTLDSSNHFVTEKLEPLSRTTPNALKGCRVSIYNVETGELIARTGVETIDDR